MESQLDLTFELPPSFRALVFVALHVPPQAHVVFAVHVHAPVVPLTLLLVEPSHVSRSLHVPYVVAPPVHGIKS